MTTTNNEIFTVEVPAEGSDNEWLENIADEVYGQLR
jgi:hypothetical protein